MLATLALIPFAVLILGITIIAISGTAKKIAPPRPGKPDDSSHEHVWGPWEQHPTIKITERGATVARVYIQERQCLGCGFVDYHREKFYN